MADKEKLHEVKIGIQGLVDVQRLKLTDRQITKLTSTWRQVKSGSKEDPVLILIVNGDIQLYLDVSSIYSITLFPDE